MRHQADIIDIFIESCLEQLVNIEKSLLDLESAGANAPSSTVDAVFRAAHSIKGDANTVSQPQIAALAHEVESLLQAVREKRLAVSRPLIDVALRSFDRLKNMVLKCREGVEEDISLDVALVRSLLPAHDPWADSAAPVMEKAPAPQPGPAAPAAKAPAPAAPKPKAPPALARPRNPATQPQAPPQTPPVASPIPKPTPPAPAARSPLAPTVSAEATALLAAAPEIAMEDEGSRIRRINVSANLLDGLVDRIGELAIAHARLARISEDVDSPKLRAVVEEIGGLSATLHGQALDMRMLPLRTCFNRFRRVVRDLGPKLGKQIELSIQGEDTEMDKTVIEQLNSPLGHLVRNAMGHGLERPEERLAQGKSETGQLALAAYQVGNEVVITVTDDGRGIDAETLRRKAVEQGLLDPAKVLSRQEMLALVFLPGLSTAKELDMVSGRGVGMDAVMAAITTMRGRVDIESESGQGTTVRMQFPLSLAIMDCLRVEVGGEDYFFHLDNVEECVETSQAQRSGNGRGIFNLRSEVVPLVYLRDFFGLPGQEPELSQVIIAKGGDVRFGIVVDRIVGRQQAVFKALGRVFGRTPGVQGATVVEDGGMAVIVDVPGMAKTALTEESIRQARSTTPRSGGERP